MAASPALPTERLPVDPMRPEPAALAKAGEVIRKGGLVAFPTETVYGLGANALDTSAVRRIFEAKGRPAGNPIIVHVASLEEARRIASEWPAAADRLAGALWPGPMTLVVPRGRSVPDIVTAGGPTVAVRMPEHPVALGLIEAAGVPIAAPSANRSGSLSPTRAEHVLASLRGRIEMILDGGDAWRGIESTVVDVASPRWRILRPGPIARARIEEVLGENLLIADTVAQGEICRSPGMGPRHYAPATPSELAADGAGRVAELMHNGLRVGWVRIGKAEGAATSGAIAIWLSNDPERYASGLYAALHSLDAMRLDRIVIDAPPDDESWTAVRDRLKRAVAREA